MFTFASEVVMNFALEREKLMHSPYLTNKVNKSGLESLDIDPCVKQNVEM